MLIPYLPPRNAFGQPLSEDGLLAALRAENAGRADGGNDLKQANPIKQPPDELASDGEYLAAMMRATGLDALTVNDPDQIALAAAALKEEADKINALLIRDNTSGFLHRMKKQNRLLIEADLKVVQKHYAVAVMHIEQLNTSLQEKPSAHEALQGE